MTAGWVPQPEPHAGSDEVSQLSEGDGGALCAMMLASESPSDGFGLMEGALRQRDPLRGVLADWLPAQCTCTSFELFPASHF